MTTNKIYKMVNLFYVRTEKGAFNAIPYFRKNGVKVFDECNQWEAKRKLQEMGCKIVKHVY